MLRRLLLLAALVMVAPAVAHAADPIVLWRTRISGNTVCGVTGTSLHVPGQDQTFLRAWAGVLVDASGGPCHDSLQARMRQEHDRLTTQWIRELTQPADATELAGRLKHTQLDSITRFDVVLLQCRSGTAENSRLRWYVDDDLDGVLDPRGLVQPGSETENAADSPSLRNALQILLVDIETNSPHVISNRDPIPGQQDGPVSVAPSPPTLPPFPAQLIAIHDRLIELDHPSRRKAHLHEVIATSSQFISELENTLRPDPQLLADLLYRKGRALGYRELPDVVARYPIEDPEALDQAFESTFAELEQLVDVTDPRYILLAIRRERRRGHFGRALELLEIYRKRHPRPIWYGRKRRDVLRKLEADLAAHQAAAELRLTGAPSIQPVPVVTLLTVPASADLNDQNVTGSWPDEGPWRSSRLSFRTVSPEVMECVIWLSAGQTYTIDGPGILRRRFSPEVSGSVLRLERVTGDVQQSTGDSVSGSGSVE